MKDATISDFNVILRPLITEKNTMLMEQNKYCFEVAREATKPMIKTAIERLFNVTVESVRTMNVRGKLRRRGKTSGYTAEWKKAIVTLAANDRIDVFLS